MGREGVYMSLCVGYEILVARQRLLPKTKTTATEFKLKFSLSEKC